MVTDGDKPESDATALLAKYIDHVGQCSPGRVFLREIPPDRNAKQVEDLSDVKFTEDEWALLRKLAGVWVER